MKKFANLLTKKNNINNVSKVFASSGRSVWEKPPTEFVKGLAVEVRSALKENVLKVLDGKDDELLKKKLNVVGVLGSCRLNVANKDVLEQLNGDNAFKILKNELTNPWIFYWTKILKNGNDSNKWLESIKELSDNPVMAVACQRQMMLNGVAPNIEHYNAVLSICADHLDSWNFRNEWDRLIRRPDFKGLEPDEGSFNCLLKLNVKRHDFNIGLSIVDVMKGKGFTPDPELLRLCEEGLKDIPEEEVEQYFKDGTLPKVYAEGKAKQDAADELYNSSFGKWMSQPPLEKLQNIDNL